MGCWLPEFNFEPIDSSGPGGLVALPPAAATTSLEDVRVALFSLLLLLVAPVLGPDPLGVVLESLLLLLDLLPPMKVVAGADVGVPADSNAFGRGLALSSDRIGRNVRTPVTGGAAVLSAVSSERVF